MIQDLQIGDNTVIGAGAVVIRSVPSHMVVAGVPARRISTTKYAASIIRPGRAKRETACDIHWAI